MNAGGTSSIRRIPRTLALPYRKLLDSLPMGVCWVGLDGRIMHCNLKMLELSGYSDAEIRRVGAKELLRDAGALPWMCKQTTSGLRESHVAGKLVRKDGTLAPVHLLASRANLGGREAVLLAAIDSAPIAKAEALLETAEHNLKEKEQALKQKDIALEQLAEQIQNGRNMLKENIAANIRDLVLPTIAKLRLTSAPAELIDLLERALKEVSSRFSICLSQKTPSLSARESEISQMIHCGLTSKQIAQLLTISCETVEKHRRNIRRKVGISGKKISLASFLNEGP